MLGRQLATLERELQECEARLHTRDAHLRASLGGLRDALRHAAADVLVVGAGLLLGAGVGRAWWRRSRRRVRREEHAEPASRRRTSTADLLQSWAPLILPVISPLLDRRVARMLALVGLPVVVPALQPLPTVEALDLERYAGRWYEIARLPTRYERKCARDVTADYAADGNGGLLVRNRCVQEDGHLREAVGRARLPDARLPGELEVSFAPPPLQWLPPAWGDYWVLFVDDAYTVSLVGAPDRKTLWVLSRTPTLGASELEALKALAERHGFDTSRLRLTPQSASAA